MVFRIPLHNATGREVLLRVAYRLYQTAARQSHTRAIYNSSRVSSDRNQCVSYLHAELSALKLTGLALAVQDLQALHNSGIQPRDVLIARVQEYRRGALAERRRLLPDYKGNRNLTPRVTNRGCQRYDCWRDPANNATLPDDLGKGGQSDGD